MRTILIGAAAFAAAAFLSACEEAGENADSAIEEVTQGEKNLGDGPLEKAGESVDSVIGTERTDDAADAINDAADGDAGTRPN